MLLAQVHLHACTSHRAAWAAALLALALLSEESAAVLPHVAKVFHIPWGRRAPVGAPRRTWPSLPVVAAWALFHRSRGGRLWQAAGMHFTPWPHPPLSWAAGAWRRSWARWPR